MTRHDIVVEPKDGYSTITVKCGENVYSMSYSDKVSGAAVADVLADSIMNRELGITSHDILMAIADADIPRISSSS